MTDSIKRIRRLIGNPTVRQALQAGGGVAMAIVAGSVISGQRWYWAAIAAFIVGVGVASRGEALIKGLQRSTGTFLGMVVGVFLASALSGHTDWSLGLVLVCVFFAFYAFQAAYSVMMFYLTLMLALLYGLIGQFQPHLLVLRLEETAAGAAAGVLAGLFTLPSQQSRFAATARDYLECLASAIREISKGNGDLSSDELAKLRVETQALRHSIGALKRGWIPLVSMQYRRCIRSAMRLSYLVREMSRRHELSRDQATRLLDEIEAIQALLDGESPRPKHAEAEKAAQRGEDPLFTTALGAVMDLREHLCAVLGRTR